MDKFQRKLRLLIVTGSAMGFLGGWGLLAHSGKPVANTSVDSAPAPTLAAPSALPPLDFNAIESSGGSSQLQPLPVIPNTQSAPSFRPRLRTRSS